MQFFHVAVTFIAQKLVAPAQIEKKLDFTIFSIIGNSLVFSY